MEEGNTVFSIRDLENFSGIKAHTIRIWEKRYHILEPERTDSNIRTYNETELKKILNVSFLNRHGIKISKIAKLDEDELTQQVVALSSISEETNQDFHPGKMLMSALKFNEELFKEALMPFIADKGIEEAYCRFFHPLLEKARILWQTGSLSRAQEQFIRNVIRNLIIIEDNLLKPHTSGTRPAVAMINTSDMLADNNFLFYKYVLKKRGFDVVFTGGILPASEVIEIYKIKPFEYLIVNSGSFDFARKRIAYFNNLGKSLMIKKIIFTDSPGESEKKSYDKMITIRNPSGFLKLIDDLAS
jgi:DNA-binding transcriptional MerR regulator